MHSLKRRRRAKKGILSRGSFICHNGAFQDIEENLKLEWTCHTPQWNFSVWIIRIHLDELFPHCLQSHKNPVSNADRKVFTNPESFCKKLIIGWRISGYFGTCPDTIQNIQIIYEVSGWTGKFSDDLKSVGMNWKVSRWCKKCIWIL